MAYRIADRAPKIPQYVRGYLEHPRETFSCELKDWIDPSQNEYDEVKVAKACLAFRNSGGGVLIIGVLDNGDLQDLPQGYDPKTIFTQDSVQGIVTAYSARSFGVDVFHIEYDDPSGSQVVAIVVTGDVTTPVMCRKDSRADRTPVVKKGIIYTRTLESNGTISSAPASQTDLDTITKTCFDNRTADFGKFLRDHLTGEHLENLTAAVDRAKMQKGTEIKERTSQESYETTLKNFAVSSADAFTDFFDTSGGEDG